MFFFICFFFSFDAFSSSSNILAFILLRHLCDGCVIDAFAFLFTVSINEVFLVDLLLVLLHLIFFCRSQCTFTVHLFELVGMFGRFCLRLFIARRRFICTRIIIRHLRLSCKLFCTFFFFVFVYTFIVLRGLSARQLIHVSVL